MTECPDYRKVKKLSEPIRSLSEVVADWLIDEIRCCDQFFKNIHHCYYVGVTSAVIYLTNSNSSC